MFLAETCRMITDVQKCKNDNLFSGQVLVLLMFDEKEIVRVVGRDESHVRLEG